MSIPFGVGAAGLAIYLFVEGLPLLRLAVSSRIFVDAAVSLVTALAATWIAIRLTDVSLAILRRTLQRRSASGLATVALPALRRIAQILLATIAAILYLHSLGFNVTALVAGLGVGGIAVALAAQRTIENLIGGIMLYADKPVRVGDFCRFAGTLGTVEEIGLRSTRVRTLDRTVVSVPNAEFANLRLENLARRDRIRFAPTLMLRHDTTPDQLQQVVDGTRRLLAEHPRVLDEDARVRFKGIGEFALAVEISAYVDCTDYAVFLEVAEDLNFRIVEIVASAGSAFAMPSTAITPGAA